MAKQRLDLQYARLGTMLVAETQIRAVGSSLHLNLRVY
jgi:hypothetical protein